MPEIEIGSKTLKFDQTKIGKLHIEFINKLLECQEQGSDTIMPEETRHLLSLYLKQSEKSILYNMRCYNVMQKFIEGLLLSNSLSSTGTVVSVTFPEQKQVVQECVNEMLILMGKTMINEDK
jgi:hypothetical protein